MAAVIAGGMTLLQLTQLFAALAGGAAASLTIGNAIRTYATAHPEDVERLKVADPHAHGKLTNWLDQMDQMERASGA